MAVKKLYQIAIGGNTYAIPVATADQNGLMSSTEFSKLQGIAEGAQVNVLEGVKVNGTALAIAGKIVDILIAEGSTDGKIKVNNVDVPVKGLAKLAFKVNVSKTELADALKTEIEGKLNSNDPAYVQALADITTLKGTGTGSVSKMIDDAFDAFVEKVTDNSVVDTFKELVDWVSTHGGEASEMAAAIQTLEGQMAGIGGEGEPATVIAAINAAVANLSIGNYYTKTEADNKFVAKESGKSLMEDAWKTSVDTKLAGVAEGANKTTYSYEESTGTLTIGGIAEA